MLFVCTSKITYNINNKNKNASKIYFRLSKIDFYCYFEHRRPTKTHLFGGGSIGSKFLNATKDKVWHRGLEQKLKLLNLPTYLLKTIDLHTQQIFLS